MAGLPLARPEASQEDVELGRQSAIPTIDAGPELQQVEAESEGLVGHAFAADSDLQAEQPSVSSGGMRSPGPGLTPSAYIVAKTSSTSTHQKGSRHESVSSRSKSAKDLQRKDPRPRRALPNASAPTCGSSNESHGPTTLVARTMKRKAEDLIPVQFRSNFQIQTKAVIARPDMTRKRVRSACPDCRRKHIQCSHGLRVQQTSYRKASDFYLFTEPFKFVRYRKPQPSVDDASEFPQVEDLRAIFRIYPIDVELHHLNIDEHRDLYKRPINGLLLALDALSHEKDLVAIAKSGTAPKYLNAMDWIVWLCDCTETESRGNRSPMLSKPRLLSNFLANLRCHLMQVIADNPLERITGDASTRVPLNHHLLSLALKNQDYVTLEEITGQYFRMWENKEFDTTAWNDWREELCHHVTEDDWIKRLDAMRSSRSQTRSEVWLMAFHCAVTTHDFDLSRRLLTRTPFWSDGLPRYDNVSCPTDALQPKTGKRHALYQNLLYTASEHENGYFTARALLMAGVDPNFVCERSKISPLQAAVASRRETTIVLLLEKQAKSDAQVGERGSPLMAAASRNNEWIAHQLLNAGADLNATDGVLGTALHVAAENGKSDIARRLLRDGARVNTQAGRYDFALNAAAYNNHIEMISILLAAGAEVKVAGTNYASALAAAWYGNAKDAFAILLSKTSNLRCTAGLEYPAALTEAACRGTPDMVRFLLASPVPGRNDMRRTLCALLDAMAPWVLQLQHAKRFRLSEGAKYQLSALQILLGKCEGTLYLSADQRKTLERVNIRDLGGSTTAVDSETGTHSLGPLLSRTSALPDQAWTRRRSIE